MANRLLLFFILAIASLFSASCTKDYVKIDEKLITNYISDQKIADAQRIGSGLYYVPVSPAPTGTRATVGKTVSVLYTGMLLNGKVFDSTSSRQNQPFEFVIGRGEVIKGWDQGIALMRKGEKAILLIPSALGYGDRGTGPIPANSVLRFDVELVDVK
ncbi:FKBP-type peptidyl-prolyl cis-trans isomerase [Hymenobacter arizonensis]|uniref:FKBP-type peptidyl-prolyl cis-trans isomerase n=1 Tax=Hymenobacter arizonensis TaxID=1227077 RepID=UPI001F315FE2|nr:FKBP-type peptidyl-prolyl cis-trans isomerase [Hymenobacter arizonensis]